ncbi:MAG TPA: alanine dehydrogenase [Candidatus Sulfomarinibacteraceae bacterium]|nr:alanine dehydrogenase [Candidatus Sulfomarinibacteraceae bacterium]
MDVGLVKDRRPFEHRIGLTPGGVRTLTERGHRVWLEDGAGLGAGFANEAYEQVGATVVYSEDDVLLRSELVVRVSPPPPTDYERFQQGQIVVSSWHLALAPADAISTLLEREVTTVGYEIIEEDSGHAPVLEAMSEIAGRLAVVLGSGLLLNDFGGKGLLICGSPGIPPASMVILGAGTLGRAATRYAQGIGAHVVVLDRDVNALRRLQDHVGYDVPTMIATRRNIEKGLAFADLFLCAVAVHGERTPILVTREMLRFMKPRTVIMDLSIDQGGCCETSRPTDFSSPTYEVDGIIHFCVPNLPSSASRASTRALTNSILPYLEQITEEGFDAAIRSNPAIQRGTYTYQGRCVRRRLAEDLGVAYLDLGAQ